MAPVFLSFSFWLSSITASGLSPSSSRRCPPPSSSIHSVNLPPPCTWLPAQSRQMTESPLGVSRGGRHSSHYLFSFHFQSLSLLCLEYVRYLTAYTLYWAPAACWKLQQWSATGPFLINMLMVRGSVCAHVCESMALHCCGSGQVPRRKHQYKDASEHITQQSISTITQQEDERVCLCVSEY